MVTGPARVTSKEAMAKARRAASRRPGPDKTWVSNGAIGRMDKEKVVVKGSPGAESSAESVV